MKKVVLFILAAVLCFGTFGGCTAKSNFGKDGKMLILIWGGDQYMGPTEKKLNSFLDNFNSSRVAEDLKVTLKFKSQTNLPTALTTALKANKGPDLVIWDRFFTASNSNVLVPISDLIERDGIDMTKFSAEAANELTVEDTIYGLPLDLDPWGIFVNMNNVNAYNTKNSESKVDVDDLGTWSKIKEAGKKLTLREDAKDPKKITTAGLNTTSLDGTFFSFASTAGTEVINTDKTSPTFGDTMLTSPLQEPGKRIMETLAYFKDLYNSEICDSGLGGTEAFVNNKLTMTYGSMYFPQSIEDYAKIDLKFIPYPMRDVSYRTENGGSETAPSLLDPSTEVNGLKNGIYGGVLGGYGLAIANPNKTFQNAKWRERKEKTWEVIKTILLDDKVNKDFFTTTEQITSRVDLHNDEYYNKNSVMSDAIKYLQYYKMRPNVGGYEQFEANILRTEIQKMYEGTSEIGTAYNNIRVEGNKLLRKAQNR